MNTPFLQTVPRNEARPFIWVVRNVRGNEEKLSGFFATREAAEKWIKKQRQEDPAFGLR